MIYKFEVEDAIEKMKKAGVNVMSGDYVIYAHPKVKFDEDLYPLPIEVNTGIPDNTAFIIMSKKDLKLPPK